MSSVFVAADTPEHIQQLWIIEAPGKRGYLLDSLKELRGDKYRDTTVRDRKNAPHFVFATRGYLMKMPGTMTDIGIDETFHEFKRCPKDQRLYDSMLEVAKRAEMIVIATDADREGDVIAYDLKEALSTVSDNIIRVKLQAMDARSVSRAIEVAAPVRKEDAVAGRTRALVDRAIGATFLSDRSLGAGRVSAGLMGLVRNGRVSHGTLTLVAPALEGGRPWFCEIECRKPMTLSLAEALASEEFPSLEKKRGVAWHYEPDNAGEIMLRANKLMGLTPSRTASIMQSCYEAGRLSYPRSHSKGFSESVAQELKRNFGDIHGVTADAVPALKSTETHEAAHAIGPVNMEGRPEEMGADEGVRTMIGQNLIRCLQFHVREYPDLAPLERFLKENDYRPDIVKMVLAADWHRETGASYPGQKHYRRNGYEAHDRHYMLLEACVRYDLGRASSWPAMIDAIVERNLVDDNGGLTAEGWDFIDMIPDALLDYRLSVKIDNICENALAVLERMKGSYKGEPWEHLSREIIRRLPGDLPERILGQLVPRDEGE